MIVCFNTHVDDPNKPALLPAEAPWHIYEFEDDNHPSIADLMSQGYVTKTPEEFATYAASIDMSAFNASLQPKAEELFNKQKSAIIEMFDAIEGPFELWNVENGIAPPITGKVVQYLHFMDHYMEVGASDEVLAELDRLISEPPPAELAPFVTVERLTDFKNAVLAGLADLHNKGII
jgi:hypothetical protein